MSYKYGKGSSDVFNKKNTRNISKPASRLTPKRVVMSKTFGNCSEKSCSTAIIRDDFNTRPRKTTKSDGSFSTRYTGKSLDYCGRCGDTVTHNTQYQPIRHDPTPIRSDNPIDKDDIEIKFNGKANGIMKSKDSGINGKTKSVKQYYKNENFKSTDSIHDTENDFRRMSLDTIKELPETHGSDNIRTLAGDCNVFEVYSDSEQIGFFDMEDGDNIDNLKKFREDNYFECHSVKSRVDSKGSVSASNLTNHKCVYRFYLNDRLFPIPLSTDHHGTVRCVECHLPMDLKMDLEQSNKANGTIQAKFKLDPENDAQDMILFLPVKDSLIIKEKRRQIIKEDDVVYFGVIKLDSFGNSVFNTTLPTDSLALKYQKGYREYSNKDDYKYKGVERDDVIII